MRGVWWWWWGGMALMGDGEKGTVRDREERDKAATCWARRMAPIMLIVIGATFHWL